MWLCLISLEQWRKKNKIIKNKLENELFTYSFGYLVVYFTLRSSFACTSLPTILCSGVSCNSISGGPLLYKKKNLKMKYFIHFKKMWCYQANGENDHLRFFFPCMLETFMKENQQKSFFSKILFWTQFMDM